MNKFTESKSDEKCYEQRLKTLATAAQKCSPSNNQRPLVISQLINEIYRSPKLGHPQQGLWSANFYTDIYYEALQKTLLEICQKIELYNPQYPVMAWVNFRLNKQFINVVNDYRKSGITDIPKDRQKEIICLPNLANLDEHLSAQNFSDDESLLRQFIEQDPEKLMAAEFLRDKPSVTFKILAKAKFVKNFSWTEIATEYDVSPTTLCSFFYRCLKKLMPYFKKYLQE